MCRRLCSRFDSIRLWHYESVKQVISWIYLDFQWFIQSNVLLWYYLGLCWYLEAWFHRTTCDIMRVSSPSVSDIMWTLLLTALTCQRWMAGLLSKKLLVFSQTRSLMQLCRTAHFLPQLSRTLHFLPQLSRTVHFLQQLSRTLHFLPQPSRTVHFLPQLSRTSHFLQKLCRGE